MSEPADSPPPQDVPPSPALERALFRAYLRHKLPEILIEAASVLVAILLAFAVDEWREGRAQRALAERARRTVLAELQANRKELRGTRAENGANLDRLAKQIAAIGDKRHGDVETGMNLSQLSAAAFQATQSTQAAQFVDFDWLVKVGRTYELQRLYVTTQDNVLVEVSAAPGALAAGDLPRAVLQRLEGRLRALQTLADGLLKAYDETIGK